ncbi:hypothetical protein D3C81_1305320 [compost metagenome]
MPGHVQAYHPLGRHAGQEIGSLIAVVAGIDDHVVDVQQQVAAGFFEHRAEELDFTHGLVRRGVVGNVFHRDAPAERILHLLDALSGMAHGFVGEGHGNQVVELTVIGAVAQVLAEQGHAITVEKNADLA